MEKSKKRRSKSNSLKNAGQLISNRLNQLSDTRAQLLQRQISEARSKQIQFDMDSMQKRFQSMQTKSQYLTTHKTQRALEKQQWTLANRYRDLDLAEKHKKVQEQRRQHSERLKSNTQRIMRDKLLAANEVHLSTVKNREKKNREKIEFCKSVRARRSGSLDFKSAASTVEPFAQTIEERVFIAYGYTKKQKQI